MLDAFGLNCLDEMRKNRANRYGHYSVNRRQEGSELIGPKYDDDADIRGIETIIEMGHLAE